MMRELGFKLLSRESIVKYKLSSKVGQTSQIHKSIVGDSFCITFTYICRFKLQRPKVLYVYAICLKQQNKQIAFLLNMILKRSLTVGAFMTKY